VGTVTWSKKAKYWNPRCINGMHLEEIDPAIHLLSSECDLCLNPWDGGVFDDDNGNQCSYFCSSFYENVKTWKLLTPFTNTTSVFPFFEENGPINDGAAGAFNADHYSTYWRDGLNPEDIRPIALHFPCYAINQFCFKSTVGCIWVTGNVQFWSRKNEGLAVPILSCTDGSEWHDYEYGTFEQHANVQVPVLSTITNVTFNCTNPAFGGEYCLRDNFDSGNNKWGAVSTGGFAHFIPHLQRFWPDTADYGVLSGLEITDSNIAAFPLNAGPSRPGVSADCDSIVPTVPKVSKYQIKHQYRYWYMKLEPVITDGGSVPNKWRLTLTVASGGAGVQEYHRSYRTTFSGMDTESDAYPGNEESTYPGDTSSVPTSAVWEGDIDCADPYIVSLDKVSGDIGNHYPDPLILKAEA
jgi:hypothetical protein